MNVPNTIDFLDAGGSRSLGLKHISIDRFFGRRGKPLGLLVCERVCLRLPRWASTGPVVVFLARRACGARARGLLEVVRNVHNGAAAVRLLLNVLLHFQVSSRD